jgi:AcrR family transcriptional regulator
LPGATQGQPRARYTARREAILSAACKVFTDRGVSGFTLAAVAKRMDLHPVSLTYDYKYKEDLAAACVLDTLDRFNAMLALAEEKATPAERLRAFVAAYFDVRRAIALGEAAQMVPFGEIKLIGAPHEEALVAAYQDFIHRIALLLKAQTDPLPGGRRQVLARLIIDQLCWSDTWISAYEPSDFARLAERVADIMIGGLAARDRRPPDRPLLILGSPLAQNDEITRERFLIAATDLINQEGYRGASVEKISARLRVTKGSFYHHNADKDGLALACFERTFELIDDAKRKAAEAADNGWDRLWLAGASLAVHQAVGERGRMLRHHALAALPVDALLAAHLVMAMFNAALPLEYWSPGSTVDTVIDAHVRPAMIGFFTPPEREL